MSQEIEKRYYTEKEFCELMGISRKTAFDWREKKLIGYLRMPGGSIRYRESDLQEYERRNGVSPRKVSRAA